MMFLGERGDGGILGQAFRIAANSKFITGNTDNIKTTLWRIHDEIKRIQENTFWTIRKLDSWHPLLTDIRNSLDKPPSINITVTGNTISGPADIEPLMDAMDLQLRETLKI
jgi:hypothetical protein